MITDAQYLAWLNSETALRCLLVEASYLDTVLNVTGTEYMATMPFVSAPTDTPASQSYAAVVSSVPEFSQTMSDVLDGGTIANLGEIQLVAAGEVFDSWILGRDWQARSLKLYLGDESWKKADFRAVWVGVIGELRLRGTNTIVIVARDMQHLLNQQTRITYSTSGQEASKPLPLCFGACINVTPLCIDTANRIYAVHDGPVVGIQAYNKRATIFGGGNITVNSSLGQFQILNTGLSGLVTADVSGAVINPQYNADGNYNSGYVKNNWVGYYGNPPVLIQTAAQIIAHIAIDRSSLLPGDVDLDSLTALELACPQALNLYVPGGSSRPYEVIDQVMASVGGFSAIDRLGRLYVKLFSFTPDPIRAITEADLVEGGLSLERTYSPVSAVSVRFARNWTGVEVPNDWDDIFAQYYRGRGPLETANNPATTYAREGPIRTVEGLFQGTPIAYPRPTNTYAAAEAARQLTLWGVPRYLFAVEGFSSLARLNLGDVVTLTHRRYGLAAGRKAIVVRSTERYSKRRVALGLLV